jgi:two-component system LytT family response regulator
MKTKAIIVDDEKRCIVALQRLIENYCMDVSVEGISTNISDAEGLIKKIEPDIVFLDVEMPEGNGFELLERFEKINFNIIFVTAYEEYAIKAIKVSALDYLLKPVKIADLQLSIERARRQIIHSDQYEVLKNNLKEKEPGIVDKIILSTMEGYYPIKPQSIIYCKADKTYTHFYLHDNKHFLASRHLKEFEDILMPYNFFRIHKSFLINIEQVEKISKPEPSSVIMSNHDELPISFRKKTEFIEKMLKK